MLKAGFSRLDVTPPFGAELAGYYTVRNADGILDPIYINSVALSNETETVLLMAIDFIGINNPFTFNIELESSKIIFKADSYIQAVEIDGDILPSDNWFSMLPGETKTIEFEKCDRYDGISVTAYGIEV